MNKKNLKIFSALSSAICVTLGITSCQDKLSEPAANAADMYQHAFIDKFGLPAEGHSYNMARATKITVKSSHEADVKVVANVGGEAYLFADYKGVSGVQDIEFDIPQGVTEVIAIADGKSYSVPVGGSIDIDKDPLEYKTYTDADMPAAKSRALDEFTFLPYVPSINMNGNVIPTVQKAITVTEMYDTYLRATGWELLDYLDKDYMEPLMDGGGNFHTWDECEHSIMYWNKHTADAVYEIGVVYPENTERDFANDNLICAPFYRTDQIKNNQSTITRFGLTKSDRWRGCAITIDFTNKTQKVVPAEWADGKSFSYFFTTLYNDKQMLADIQDMLPYQDLLPKASDWHAGSPEYGLPPYDESNTAPFWNKWDEFVYDWAQDNLTEEQRSHLHELVQLKEYFGFFYMCFPSEHAYPIITKDDDNAEKYTITYFTTRYFSNSPTIPEVTDTEMYEIVPYANYNSELQIGIDQTSKYAKRFGYYVRNCTTGKIYTTLSGNHTYAHYRFLCGSNHSLGRQEVIQMDLNDDGVYDDFIMFGINRVVSSENVSFKPFSWIIAAEDLGSTDDWDFNDLVCEVSYVSTNSTSSQEITVRPLAAGGIYPIYLMYTDPLEAIGTHVIGTELHKWLGQGLDIYNTGDSFDTDAYHSQTVKFTYDVALHEGKRFSLDKFANTIWEGSNMGGFWVLVDKENRYDNIIADNAQFLKFDRVFDDAVTWPELTLINTPIRNDFGGDNLVPMIMCVGNNWEWPTERSLISDSYPLWLDWLTNPNSNWYGEGSGMDASKVTKRFNRE